MTLHPNNGREGLTAQQSRWEALSVAMARGPMPTGESRPERASRWEALSVAMARVLRPAE